jgi:hypothetical protein
MIQTSLDQYYEIIHILYLYFTTNDPVHRYSYKLELSKLIAKL